MINYTNEEYTKFIKRTLEKLPLPNEEELTVTLGDMVAFREVYLYQMPVEVLQKISLTNTERKLIDYLITFEESWLFVGELMCEGAVTGMFNHSANDIKRRAKNLKGGSTVLNSIFNKMSEHIQQRIEFSDDDCISHIAFHGEDERPNTVVAKISKEQFANFQAMVDKVDEDYLWSLFDELEDALDEIWEYLEDKYRALYGAHMQTQSRNI